MTVKEWNELCLNDGKIYYWDSDDVQIRSAKECIPSYREGDLKFILDHDKLDDFQLFDNELDCVKHHIADVSAAYNIGE